MRPLYSDNLNVLQLCLAIYSNVLNVLHLRIVFYRDRYSRGFKFTHLVSAIDCFFFSDLDILIAKYFVRTQEEINLEKLYIATTLR